MRVRIRFTKRGKLRWTSHRDVARIWERTLRRAGVAVAYSGGFSPRPRLSFGLALPTGAESVAEYLDAELDPEPAPGADPGGLLPEGMGGLLPEGMGGLLPEGLGGFLPEGMGGLLPEGLGGFLPEGMDVVGTAALQGGDASLQHAVVACRWEAQLPAASCAELAGAAQRFMDAPSVVVTRERKGQQVTDDIRPSVLSLEVAGPTLACRLATQLDGQPRGLRPAELIGALGIDPADARLLRTHQWIERDGAWCEPVPATDAPHAQRRAS